jgi:hypothetical protein
MFEDITVVIRNRKSRKDRQCSSQKKKKKSQAIFKKTLHGGLQIEQHGPLISGLNSLLQNGKQLLFN